MKVPRPARGFVERLQAQPDNQLEDFVSTSLLDGAVPHIFGTDAAEHTRLRRFLSDALQVAAADIHVIGSAKLGFSLNPDHYFQRIHDRSDVDVVLVHTGLFDFIWHGLLRWSYQSAGADAKRVDVEKEWVSGRRREVWKGWFEPRYWDLRPAGGVVLSVPEALKPARDFASNWFTTFRSLGRYRHPEIAGRVVRGRLYRTYDHVRIYHAHGLRHLKQQQLELQ